MAYGYDGGYVDLKKAKASTIANYINLKWYDEELDDVRKRIANIRSGKPEFTGYRHQDTVLRGKDAERRIKELERYMKTLKKEKAKYSELVQLSRSADYRLDDLARKDALFTLFDRALDSVERVYNPNTRRFDDSKVLNENRKPLLKAHRKDDKTLRQSRRKITKKAYHLLKKYAKKMEVKFNNTSVRLDYIIDKSIYSLTGFYDSLYREKREKYENGMYSLGVNTRLLDDVKSNMKDINKLYYQPFCVSDSYQKYEKLTRIKNRASYAQINGIISKFVRGYEEILRRGKDLRALQDILLVFKDTEVKDSEAYRNIVDICEKEKENLTKMVQKINREYEKANLPELMKQYDRLEALYRDYLYEVANHRNSEYANQSWSVYMARASEYRMQMYAILIKYPELNREEYHIDLKEFKKEELVTDVDTKTQAVPSTGNAKSSLADRIRAILERKGYTRTGSTPEDTVVVKPLLEVAEEPKSLVDESKKTGRPVKVVADSKPEYTYLTEDDKLRQPIEMPSHLIGLTVVYYQEYMRAKAINSEYRKLKYYEYLELTHPELGEYIEVEKAKEKRAATIYGKYLQYRAALPNKENAMSFKQFALEMYNLESYDIPTEYLEEGGKKL